MRRAVSKIIPNRQSKFFVGGNDKSNQPSNNNQAENHGGHSLANHLSNLSFKIDFNSIADFYILLDNPHKSWLPGDEVSGQIILISKKNLANISITLSLVGFVKINASSHSKLRPIKHNLFHHTIDIYGGNTLSSVSDENNDEYSNGLYKGEHRFPFIVKLPNKRVFTSIDFGKGSITYLLRAALGNTNSAGNLSKTNSNNGSVAYSPSSSQGSDSNPNSPSNLINKTKYLKIINNPSYTSEKFIKLINPIDVAKLPPPKPKKLIIKDPRYAKKLSRTQSSTSTINTVNTYSTMSSNNSDNATNVTTAQDQTNSPALANDASTFPHLQQHHHHHHHHHSEPNQLASQNSVTVLTPNSDLTKPESIKVALEIPQRGYLRGELIPIKFNISHLKKIQDLNGIIITFVRVCRLDNGPDGMFESFRKDLQQSVIPLYVDPNTFQLEINTSVRVPADAFPTISGCPLVSFQYFIEVLINLSGKSVSLDNTEHSKGLKSDEPSHLFDGNSSSPNNPHSLSHSNLDLLNSTNANDDFKFKFNFNVTSPINQSERSGFINTDKFKRMKKFIQITTEVIIGTHRSNEEPENATTTPANAAYSSSALVGDGEGSAIAQSNVGPAPTGSNIISPLSRRSSLFSGSNGSPNAFSGSGSSSSPAQVASANVPNAVPPHLKPQSQRSVNGATNWIHEASGSTASPSSNNVAGAPAGNAVPYINVIPEAVAVSNFETPPYFSDANNQFNQMNSGDYDIPNYEEISDAANANAAAPIPEQSHMSEKDRMKAHESSLLPSEPPLDDMADDDDRETISPIDKPNEILESIDEEDNSTLNQNNNSSGNITRGNDVTDFENNSNTYSFNRPNTYQFFTTPNEEPSQNEEAIDSTGNENSDDDDLYHTNLDIIREHDGLGFEMDTVTSDFVPNYETANKDKLILANTSKNQNEGN